MKSAVLYDAGEFMPLNQDALFLEQLKSGRRSFAVAAVCDGIGGLRKGEEASALVTGRIREYFRMKGRDRAGEFASSGRILRRLSKDLTEILRNCNLEMNKRGDTDDIKMGTTCTLLLMMGKKGTVLHTGDSRAYLISGKNVRQLTKDDRKAGENILTKCVGSFPWKGISTNTFRVPKYSCLFLCTDGLWNKVTEEELVHSFGGLREAEEELLQRRLRGLLTECRKRGERDNAAGVVLWTE